MVVVHLDLHLTDSFIFSQMGYYPFNRQQMLSNPKIRHAIGQSTETDQVTKMREMEKRYETLKVTCEEQGKYDVFTLHFPFAILCINL
jgi:hypothetical protein